MSAEFAKDGEAAPGTAIGMLSLYVADHKAGEGRIKTQPAAYAIAGAALTVGWSHDMFSRDYPGERLWRFTGDTIEFVAVDVSGEPYVDLEREATAMQVCE